MYNLSERALSRSEGLDSDLEVVCGYLWNSFFSLGKLQSTNRSTANDMFNSKDVTGDMKENW